MIDLFKAHLSKYIFTALHFYKKSVNCCISKSRKKYKMLNLDIENTKKICMLEQKFLDKFNYNKTHTDFYKEIRNKQQRRLTYLSKLLIKRGKVEDLQLAFYINKSNRIVEKFK